MASPADAGLPAASASSGAGGVVIILPDSPQATQSWPRRLYEWLVEPAGAPDPESRLKARWLASILVLLVPIGLLVAAIPALLGGDPPWHDQEVRLVFGLSLLFALCYLLVRRGRYRLGGGLALALASVAICGISLISDDPQNLVNDVTYLTATLLLSSILLSLRATGILFACSVAAMLLLPSVTTGISLRQMLSGPLSLLIVLFALMLFGRQLANRLEAYHLRTLQAENAERRRAEEGLRASLAEKEVLLKEVHHRVKNNLQVISSLLSLQAAAVDDPTTVAQFRDSQLRIRAMALVHERLYTSPDLAEVDFGVYLRDLTNHLLVGYGVRAADVRLTVTADDIRLDLDKAIPCGLLVNELVSNALKHAFPPGAAGDIAVVMGRTADDRIRLAVRDTGVGMPAGYDWRNAGSLGLQLVSALTHQLGGRVEMRTGPGTEFRIDFPVAAADRAVAASQPAPAG